jgi:hypothetical protein
MIAIYEVSVIRLKATKAQDMTAVCVNALATIQAFGVTALTH